MSIIRRLQLSTVAAIAACLTFATPALAQLQWNYTTNAQGNAQATYPGTVVIGSGAGCSGAAATLCADNLAPANVHVPSVPAGSVTQGGVSVGTLGFSDTGLAASWQGSINGYLQTVVQNTNSGAAASGDYVVCNNLCTASTYYGDFGINSSGYTGSGSFNLPNATYLFSVSGDLSLGTYSANGIHIVLNNGATDVMDFGITNAGAPTFNTNVFQSVGSYYVGLNGNLYLAGVGGVVLASAGPIRWNSDTQLCRYAAGVVEINNAAGSTCGNGGAIEGVSTNSNAPAGAIGEYISANVASGSAVALASNTAANVTSISLTAGDWDVTGNVCYSVGGSTVSSSFFAAINTVSATLPTAPGAGAYQYNVPPATAGIASCLPTGQTRISIASTTTVYLLALSGFSGSTSSAYGFIGARRAR